MANKNQSTHVAFGGRVRALRKERSLTLAILAEASDVSKAMLSKVERGEKNPTLAVASRIARGLNIGLSNLLGAAVATDAVSVVRSCNRVTFVDSDTGFMRELLSPAMDGTGIEVARHVIPPESTSGSLPAYPSGTRKFVYVEQGALILKIAEQTEVLGLGDTVSFDADVSHCFINTDKVVCSYLLVVSRQA